MADTPARLLNLLSLLQTPREWPGPELAQRLSVSTRTIRNDIERLRDLGYPVDASRGPIGGYRLVAGTAMPPLLLDDEEAVAIAVSLRTAAGGAIAGIEETSLRALTKLQQVLPKRLRHRVDALQTHTVQVGGGTTTGPLVDGAGLALMAAAAHDRERIRFGYLDHAGTATQRRAEPHRLVNWGRRWYLVAWDVDRQDWRTFRADRISEPTGSGLRFAPRDAPADDLGEYLSRNARQAQESFRAKLLVQAGADHVAERMRYSLAVIEPIDEHSCVLEVGADSARSLANWIALLDADFEVISPPEFTEALAAIAQRYLDAAKPRSRQ